MGWQDKFIDRRGILIGVMNELSPVLPVLRTYSEIREARVFGSAGRQRPGRDIDIAILVESDLEEWSAYTVAKRKVGFGDELDYEYAYIPGATDTRLALSRALTDACSRVEPHIATYSDLERVKTEGSPVHPALVFRLGLFTRYSEEDTREYMRLGNRGFGDAMMNGVLIYQRL